MQECGNLAVKLLRTYTAQIEALAKLRRGGEQTVRVELVHVHSGGQAIVGAVTHQSRQGEGMQENDNQPHAAGERATGIARRATLRSAHAQRIAMPFTGC